MQKFKLLKHKFKIKIKYLDYIVNSFKLMLKIIWPKFTCKQ